MPGFEERYLDGEYLGANATWHEEDGRWKASKIFGILSRNGVAPSSVTEVGCGSGSVIHNLSEMLSHSETHYQGFDISPLAIEIASQRPTEVRFELGSPPAGSGADPVDVLLAIDVLEHVPDYLGFIESCRPLGVKKVFHIPLDISVSSVLRGSMINTRESVGHLHYFSSESALASLTDLGYLILDCEFTCGSIELFRTHPSIKKAISNVPRWIVGKMSRRMSSRIWGGYSLLVLAE